ncbi:MAG: hypothetical protein LUF78_00825 [Clostridiales bacterium]|nr:hypothetical protein [Clostridiales bacterium]
MRNRKLQHNMELESLTEAPAGHELSDEKLDDVSGGLTDETIYPVILHVQAGVAISDVECNLSEYCLVSEAAAEAAAYLSEECSGDSVYLNVAVKIKITSATTWELL